MEAVAPGGPARDPIQLLSPSVSPLSPGVTLYVPAVTWCPPASPCPSLVSPRVPQCRLQRHECHLVPPPASSPGPGVTSCHPMCHCVPLSATLCVTHCCWWPHITADVPSCPQHHRVSLPVSLLSPPLSPCHPGCLLSLDVQLTPVCPQMSSSLLSLSPAISSCPQVSPTPVLVPSCPLTPSLSPDVPVCPLTCLSFQVSPDVP